MNTRSAILEELRVSRKVIAVGQEIMPRFLIYAPTGNHTIRLPLPDEPQARAAQFRLARLFMVWRAATGFILSSETKIPDTVTATLVSRTEVIGAAQLITREPLTFGEPTWYGREALGDEIVNLLPAKSVRLSAADLETIRDFETNRVSGLTGFDLDDGEE